jgi:anti-anti-sigma factor
MAFIHSESDGVVCTVHFDEPQMADASTIRRVQDELVRLVEEIQERCLLLDFGNVTLLSSSALGMLTRVHRRCKDFGRTMKLCNIAPDIQHVFQITGLKKVLEMDHDADPPGTDRGRPS